MCQKKVRSLPAKQAEMLKLSKWIGEELISLEEAFLHLRIDDEQENRDYLERITIPAARGMAEEITGSLLRKGIYTETIFSGQSLAKGNVTKIESVFSGEDQVGFQYKKVADRTVISAVNHSFASLPLEVTFEAGFDREECPPQLRSWLLMVCGFLYKDRDLSKESPKIRVLDFMLSSFSVPNPF